MALLDEHLISRNRAVVAAIETTAGVHETLTGSTDSMLISELEINPSRERIVRRDAHPGYPGAWAQIDRKLTATWNAKSYVLPRGGALSPRISPFLESFFGEAPTVGSDVEYAFATGNAIESFTLVDVNSTFFARQLLGAVTDEFTIEISDSAEPMFSFSGPAKKAIETGSGVLSAASDDTDEIVLDPGEAENFDVGSLIDVGANTNSGAGFLVTAIDYATDTLTLSAVVAAGQAIGSVVAPHDEFVLTGLTEAPVFGHHFSLTYDGGGTFEDTGVSIAGMKITGKRNVKSRMVAGTETVEFFIPGNREITGSITFFGRVEDLKKVLRRRRLSSVNPIAIQCVLGDSITGSFQCVIDLPAVSLDYTSSYNFGGTDSGEEATIEIPFVARESGIEEDDALTMTWQTSGV